MNGTRSPFQRRLAILSALCYLAIAAGLVASAAHADEEPDERAGIAADSQLSPTSNIATIAQPPTITPAGISVETAMPVQSVPPTPSPVSTDSGSAEPTRSIETEPGTITATSAASSSDAVDLSLSISGVGASFGEVSADGGIDGAGNASMEHVIDGAAYIVPGAVILEVASNVDWVIVSTIEDTGSWGGKWMEALTWRVSGGSEWRAFEQGMLVAKGHPGTTTLVLDYRLIVTWDFAPGALNAKVTYQVVASP